MTLVGRTGDWADCCGCANELFEEPSWTEDGTCRTNKLIDEWLLVFEGE